MPIAAASSLGILAGVLSLASQSEDSPEVRLLAHEELSSELERIAAENGDIAALHLVGRSREGRKIEALRLTAPGDHEEARGRPAILLVAGLEGPRVFESGVALHHAERLASGYGHDQSVRSLLDSTVVWIVPRANPDPAEARFDTPRQERWTGSTGVDNDRDGRRGEDPPSDVNGDGLVTQMRVLDPDGEWKADPTDERALVKRDPNKGERGLWKVYPEGNDLDGDEEAAEDPVGDTRADRNFPSGWMEHAPDAGPFATDEPEARDLVEFVLAQANLVLVMTYDGLDNLVEKPDSVEDDAPRVKRVPPAGVLESDAKLLEEIGRRYREMTENEATGGDDDGGTFQRWCYDHRGLVALNAVLWSMPTEAPKEEEEGADEEGADEGSEQEEEGETTEEPDREPAAESPETTESEEEPSEDAKHLEWIDGTGEAWRFVDWTPFEHPQLGAVEIGGFAPFAKLEPPPGEWQGIADRHLEFFKTLGGLVPRIAVAECSKERLGEGVWRVETVIQNDALLPLLSRSARRTRTIRPARVRLVLPDAGTILSGAPQHLLRELAGSGGRAEYSWLIQGPSDMDVAVSVDTDHAGEALRVAEEAQ